MLNHAPFSTQLHPPPPTSSDLHPAHFSLHPAVCNTLNAIRTKIQPAYGKFPEFRTKNSKLSVLPKNWHTWYPSGTDCESGLRFSKFRPQNLFLGKFVPKKSKLSILPENWHTSSGKSWFWNHRFLKFRLQILFLGKFAPRKYSFIFIWDLTAVFGHRASFGFIFQNCFTFFCCILQVVLKALSAYICISSLIYIAIFVFYYLIYLILVLHQTVQFWQFVSFWVWYPFITYSENFRTFNTFPRLQVKNKQKKWLQLISNWFKVWLKQNFLIWKTLIVTIIPFMQHSFVSNFNCYRWIYLWYNYAFFSLLLKPSSISLQSKNGFSFVVSENKYRNKNRHPWSLVLEFQKTNVEIKINILEALSVLIFRETNNFDFFGAGV